MTPHGIALGDDLIFFSRISGSARAAGFAVRQAKSPADALALARQSPPACVIVDLQTPGLDLTDFLVQLKAAGPALPRVIAYGSHVEAETLKAARAAGCDRVMPRSKFAAELEGAIAGWLAPAAAPAE
ncbi:response regulator [Gemmata sp.]|uniref:response regulator n=1 Tax=Gemmata sp. TaxID=1914242 RepID=UPI003F6E8122